MLKVNAMGDTCPIPVVKTKDAIRQLGADGGDDGGCRNDCIRFRHGAAHPPFETAAGLFHRQ